MSPNDAPPSASPWVLVGAWAGALPVLLSWFLFELAIDALDQVAAVRAVGLLAALALCNLAAAALLAAATHALGPGLWRVRWLRCVPAVFASVALVNVAKIGLFLFDEGPAQALIAGVTLAGLARVWASGPVVRRAIAACGLAGGWMAAGLPLLLSPWVLWSWAHFQHRAPGAPPVQRGAVRDEAPTHVVLVVLDALSYEATSLAHPGLGTTPHLAALAARSHLFTNCRAAGDRTPVSMPTMLAGVPPYRFRTCEPDGGDHLRPGLLTSLAGQLKAAGYQAYYETMLVDPGQWGFGAEFTAGHAMNAVFDENLFDRVDFIPWRQAFDPHVGWDGHQVSLAGEVMPHGEQVPPGLAPRLTFARALEALHRPGKSFIWVHIGAPHTPYRDPQSGRWLDDTAVRGAPASALGTLRRAYAHNVRLADAELGAFCRRLAAEGLDRSTLLVVTADHGEALTPTLRMHGLGQLPESITHVPLLIHLPNQRSGARHAGLCGQIDVAPTVLAAVYADGPRGFAGRPLLGRPTTERPVFSWALETPEGSAAVYAGRYKYLWRQPSGRGALYDLARDPQALHDLARAQPGEARRLQRLLEAELAPAR